MSTSAQPGRRLSRRRVAVWSFALVAAIAVGAYVRAEIQRRTARFEGRSSVDLRHAGGMLLIVGGGPVADSVRGRFVELAGGGNARLVVIPAAAVDDTTLTQYRETWLRYDVRAVDVLHADSRRQADEPGFSRILETATGVWLGGGQQSWLANRYGGTLVEERLKGVLARNGIVGGTSAGAAVMSGVMIAGGRETPKLARGFDLIPGAIIDQHFVKRNRFRRLQAALRQHPELVGFGIDEGAALLYGVQTGQLRVLGTSCVVTCVPLGEQGEQRFSLEFLNPGDEFDMDRLRQGQPVPPNYVDLDSILLGG